MGKLLLNSLEIQNFRCFRHLLIEKLGQVNLIVGRNNVGKTSLLEALELYANRGAPNLIWQFLRARDETRDTSSSKIGDIYASEDRDVLLDAIRYLFYGRAVIGEGGSPSIHIGPANSSEDTLAISLNWFMQEIDPQEETTKRWRLLQPEENADVNNLELRFAVELGQKLELNFPFQFSRLSSRAAFLESQAVKNVSIKASGLAGSQTSSYWDRVTLTDLEQEILGALQILAPGVNGLSFVGGGDAAARNRVPVIRMKDNDGPLPLKSLGNGMQRMLGIALALVNVKDGILLIDEIESGIHYSAQQELWQVIFRLAHRLNIQVFATTHSWDCIEAFQKVVAEDKEQAGMLIRLSLRKDDDIKPVLYDERRLSIATREQIEVR